MNDGNPAGGALADLERALQRIAEQAGEQLENDEELRQLAEAFAARHGYSPPARPSPPDLPPALRFAIESGLMSEGLARDVDATCDGLLARVRAGELTEEQGLDLAGAAAIRDGEAVNRARARAGKNRHERRAEAAKQRGKPPPSRRRPRIRGSIRPIARCPRERIALSLAASRPRATRAPRSRPAGATCSRVRRSVNTSAARRCRPARGRARARARPSSRTSSASSIGSLPRPIRRNPGLGRGAVEPCRFGERSCATRSSSGSGCRSDGYGESALEIPVWDVSFRRAICAGRLQLARAASF